METARLPKRRFQTIKLHGETTQKTATFFSAVKTSNYAQVSLVCNFALAVFGNEPR
jgi:hypothetical protein